MATLHELGPCDSGGVQDGAVHRSITSFSIDDVEQFRMTSGPHSNLWDLKSGLHPLFSKGKRTTVCHTSERGIVYPFGIEGI